MKRMGFGIGVIAFLLICGVFAAGCILPQAQYVSDTGPYLVLDTDPGTDDAIAYLLLEYYLSSDSMLIGTAGNVPLEQVQTNIILLHDYLDSRSILFFGASTNLDGDPMFYDGFCGPDGLGNMSEAFKKRTQEKHNLTGDQLDSYLELMIQHVENESYDKIAKILLEQDSITYVLLGPHTTLARLIMEYPELVDKIDHVYIMGGGFNITNAPNGTEFNFATDSKASVILFKSGLNITLVPLDTTTPSVLTAEQIQQYKDTGNYSEMVGILEYGYDAALAYNESTGFMLHDPSAIVCAVGPEAFTFRNTHITIDEYGATREAEDGYPVRLATSVDSMVIASTLADIFGVTED